MDAYNNNGFTRPFINDMLSIFSQYCVTYNNIIITIMPNVAESVAILYSIVSNELLKPLQVFCQINNYIYIYTLFYAVFFF